MNRSMRYGIPFVCSALVSLAVFACSSDDDGGGSGGTGGSGDDAGPGAGGKSDGAGGAPAAGGKAAAGGAVSAGGAPADLYNCQKLPPRDPGGDGADGAECCEIAGTKYGVCTKASEITDPLQKSSFGFDSCDKEADLKCAPTAAALADAGALGVFASCSWTVGTRELEGRCLPKCFIAGNPAASQLVQADCEANLLCAPCFNPIDGTKTGACEFKEGDTAAEPAPEPFVECGGETAGEPGGGLCVPKDLALASNNPAAEALTALTCAEGEVCAPTVKVRDLQGCFEKCATVDTLAALGPQYASGGCVPAYVVTATNPMGSAILQQGTCAAGEQCAPCLNPLSMPPDAPTGACE